MKKIIYSIGIIVAVALSSCDDSFLDQKNLFQASYESYYSTPAQIEEAMGGVYNALYVGSPHSNEHLAANLLSDCMLAGGGPDDRTAKWVDNFEDPNEDTYKDLWVETYKGVNRCNAIIEAVQTKDFSNFFKTDEEAEAFKNQSIGEAHFMRAFHMFRGAKFFGGMPLIPTTLSPLDVPRASLDSTYAFIASDLKMAIDLLPAVPANDISIDRYGHANKWVAEAYMAKVYLFYTGYMTNIEKKATSELPLMDGGSITKTNAVGYLEDCMTNSNFALASDFRNLWPYSFLNENARTFDPNGTHPVLPWAETEGLSWVGQDGHKSVNGTGNTEVMFAQRFAFGNWGWDKGQSYNNRVCLYFGIRDNSMVPFGQGWGWGTIHPTLRNEWPNEDLRKKGSILDMGDDEQGTGGYSANKGDHETGMFNKKYTTIQHGGKDDVKGMFYYLYDMDNGDPLQLWAAQDFYFMRYADVLLMHSELTETATGLNQVRKRAGYTDDIAYSLDAIKIERKYEFAFEGIRWFDLVRWGDVEDDSKNYFSNVVDVVNSGVEATYSVKYRPETKGLLPVPESEIRLSNGVYSQNPGW